MEREGEEESGEMLSPNESGEYTPHNDMAHFTVQGLRDALTAAESTVTEPPHSHRRIHYSARSNDGGSAWKTVPTSLLRNGGMGLHVLKSDLALRELEHIQVDSPGLAYLFFYERHGH